MTTILLTLALSLVSSLYVQRRERWRIARALEELAPVLSPETTGAQALSATAKVLRRGGSLGARRF